MADDGPVSESAATFNRWLGEIEYAQKDEKYKQWIDRSEKIIKRYRDERKQSTAEFGKRRFNVLWSNVQTLQPAVYGKMPKPIVERRFLDRDPVARLSSLMLERSLSFQMEAGKFHQATNKAVTDYLLPGAGQVWLRYKPEFAAREALAENEKIEASEGEDELDEDGDGTPVEKLTFERVCFDYVFYRDFLWGPARCWDEVPWVAKRSWLDKSEATEAFGKEIAGQMIFGDPKNRDWATANEPLQLGKSKKAEVWEIWNKANRCVYFIAPDTPGLVLKTEEDDPLKLEGFWPCPEPLFATQTNETLIPVPDYVEYQDQAAELDTLTQRIAVVTTAIRANGVYDSQYPALARLFQDGQDNKLIPVDQWAAFAEKGGMPGALSLVPMDMLVKVLTELYAARDHVKQDLYEITGMSDIVRGSTDPNETMGAQKIKARFASGRLGSRQQQVAEFCAALVKLAAEIVSEVFSPDSIKLMSGMDQIAKEDVRKAIEGVPKPEMPQPQEGQPPPSPQEQQAMQQQMAQQYQQAQQQAAMAAQQKSAQEFEAAIALLRDDKLRGFRVDIETDSTLADDMGEDRSEATDFVTAVIQSFEAAAPVIQTAPEMAKPVGEMLLWALRKFRVGRTLEAAFESAMDELEERIAAQKDQPPAPDPDMIKAQAAVTVAQAKAQSEQVSAQAEAQKSQSEIQVAQTKLQGEERAAALQTKIDALTLQLDGMKAAAENDTVMEKARLESLTTILVARITAKTDTDSAVIDAQLEAMLGFAKMDHEKDMQATDHAQETSITQTQVDAQQATAETKAAAGPASTSSPAPKSKSAQMPMFAKKTDMQHEQTMGALQGVQGGQSQMAEALARMADGLNAMAQAQAAPKRVVFGPNGKPIGIETVKN